MKRAFPGAGLEVAAAYERCGKWLLATVYGRRDARDWCDRKGVAIQKAASEGIGSGGGFVVPLELEQAILDLRDSFGAFRRRATIWPMSRDSSVFPRRAAAGATATFFGENSAAASAQLTVDGVQLTAKKLGVLITLSSELDEDSIFDLVDYVANELAWAFAAKEDDCAVNGDGTSAYGGMYGFANIVLDGNHNKAKVTAGHNTYGALLAADFAAVQAAVRASAIPNAAWYISATGNSVALLNEATGGYIDTQLVDGIPTRFFNGFPIILTNKLSLVTTSLSGKAMLAFGDMRAAAVLGQRRGITIARSDHRYLDTDQIAILGTERFDAVIHDMGDNANYGSLAVLVGS